jgi:hypothetical protein
VVVASLSLGAVAGVVLSAGFLWFEVGRYATPQVPVTVFDERKVLAGYTVGLFVGVPLAAAYVLLAASILNGAVFGIGLFLGGIVVGSEVAQRLLVRSGYWGRTPAAPFYAVSFRAGIGAILALAVVAGYLGAVATPTADGLAAALTAAVALVALEVAGGLLSIRRSAGAGTSGGAVAGGIFGAVAFFLLGVGPAAGVAGSLAAPLIVLAGAVFAYRARRGILAEVPPPTGAVAPRRSDRPLAYGRTSPPPEDPAAARRP